MLKNLKLKPSSKKENAETLSLQLKSNRLADLVSCVFGIVIFILELIFGNYLLLTATWLSIMFSKLAVMEWIEVIATKKKKAIIEAILQTIVFLFIFTTLCIDIIFHL